MIKLFRNISFRWKIIIIFLFMTSVNCVVTGILYYNYAYKDTINNYYNSVEDMVKQINVHMYDRFDAIANRVNALNNNLSFVNPMKVYLSNPESTGYARLMGSVADYITEIEWSDSYISSVYIVTPFGDFDNFLRIRDKDFDFKKTDMYRFMSEHPYETIGWFPSMENPIYKDDNTVIPIIYKQRIGQSNIFIIVNIEQYQIEEYLKNTYSKFDNIFIVDSGRNNILNYGEAEISVYDTFEGENLNTPKSKEVTYDGGQYIATCSEMKGNGWKIFTLTSTASLIGNLNSLRGFIMIELAVTGILCLMFIVFFAFTLTAPLARLVNVMNKTVKEGFHTEFDYQYHDEIGNLAKSYNYMVREIEELVGELNIHIEALKEEKENIKLIQEQKRKAELRALQAQINPHFLYNTLNAITWQAADQGAREISILSNALGKFFRVSLSKGREVITLKEEIDHVTSYLEIQKIRYKSKINYDIIIHQELMNKETIKLILQPLVENAIYHGIKEKEYGGSILVRGGPEQQNGKDVIRFYVEDDGIGIEEEKLQLLNCKLAQGIVDSDTGYGIYNVNERLRLYFGNEYGLRLESKQFVGTKAILTIPLYEKEEEIDIVPDSSSR